jgi:hypothetical protein
MALKPKHATFKKVIPSKIEPYFIKNTVFNLLYIIMSHLIKIKPAIVRKFTGVIFFKAYDFIITK